MRHLSPCWVDLATLVLLAPRKARPLPIARCAPVGALRRRLCGPRVAQETKTARRPSGLTSRPHFSCAGAILRLDPGAGADRGGARVSVPNRAGNPARDFASAGRSAAIVAERPRRSA